MIFLRNKPKKTNKGILLEVLWVFLPGEEQWIPTIDIS
jgi:hypothetical protein